MRPAPGSQLPIDQILGRDAFIQQLWDALETGSIRIEAERRIGKTSVLHKMEAEPPPGWEPVLLDLEEVHTAAEFSEKVCRSIHARLTGWKREGRRLRSFLEAVGGTTVGPIKFPGKEARTGDYWKRLLTDALEDLVEQQREAGKRVVFFFDELPWMLSAIAERDGMHTAMEVLDLLRSLRQSTTTGRAFRMVLCGSIGLHHVLEELKKAGYRNRPINDLILIEVPPLDPVAAIELATRLLAGGDRLAEPTAVEVIAEHTGGFAYYIHWVVLELGRKRLDPTPDAVRQVIGSLLTAPHDPCEFRHFKDRIAIYYPNESSVVIAILDHAAASTGPVGMREMINVAKTAGATDDNRIRELLRLLAVDHYLDRDSDGNYRFRHVLLRKWWVLEQGLEPAETEE